MSNDFYSDCYMDPVHITEEELRKSYSKEFWEHFDAKVAEYRALVAARDAEYYAKVEAEKSE